jgi:hypothetical protein
LLESGLSEAKGSSLRGLHRRTWPSREDGDVISVLFALSSGNGGLAGCAVLGLFEYIEVVSKSESAVHTPALHTRAAHAGGFEIHDAVAPLQRARLWRIAVLLKNGLKQSVCTGFGWYLVLGELGEIGLTEVRLVEIQLDWEVEARIRLLWSIAAAVHVFLVYLSRRTTIQSRTRIRLVGFVAKCAAEWAVR